MQWVEVGASAMSLSCPSCARRIVVQDLVVQGVYAANSVQTCGWVVVERRGQLSASVVQAGAGVEVHGSLRADVVSLGPVVISGKARWRGDCRTPKLDVEPGAVIEGGSFDVGPMT